MTSTSCPLADSARRARSPSSSASSRAARPVRVVAGQVGGEGIVAREGRCEDDAGLVTQWFGQLEALRQTRALGGGAVAHHERDARVAQGVDPGPDRELCRAVEGADALGGDPELLTEVERSGAGRELEHVALALDRLEARAAVALHQPRDVLVEDRVAEACGDDVDQLLAAQQPSDVVVVEDVLGAGEAERCPGDDDGYLRGRRPGDQARCPREELEGEASERSLRLGRDLTRGRRGRRWTCDRRRRGRSLVEPSGRGAAHPEAGGVEPAERLIEGDRVRHLGVVGEERDDVRAAAEDVVGEALQRPLGTDLDEDARAGRIQRLQPLHELDRRGHLAAEDVDHLGRRPGAHGIELSAHVGDDGQRRRLEPEPPEHEAQRLARRRHDAGVEGVAHRQRDGRVLRGLHRGDRALDGRRRAADHALLGAVQVCDLDVPLDASEDALDLAQGRQHGGHRTAVLDRQARHLAAARAHRLEGILERQGARRDQCAVLAEAVPHHQIGHDAVGGEQARERDVGRQHGGLRHRRLLERPPRRSRCSRRLRRRRCNR